jgi:hypothetical protein
VNKNIRQLAVSVAGLGFFLLAIIGTLMGADPTVCALRALAGSCALFLLVRFAAQQAVKVLSEGYDEPAPPMRKPSEEPSGDHRSA